MLSSPTKLPATVTDGLLLPDVAFGARCHVCELRARISVQTLRDTNQNIQQVKQEIEIQKRLNEKDNILISHV